MCEIVSNLKDKNGNELLSVEKVQKVLAEKAHCIREYSFIIHDKDTYTQEDEERNPDHKAGQLKAPHLHILLRFHERQPQKISSVASWFSIAPNFVEKIKGRWVDAVKYLTHANAPEKAQYPVTSVISNFDIEAAMVDKYQALEDVLKKICSGEIREYNKTLLIDHMMLIENAREIETAFKLRSEHLQATKLKRNTSVIFITGPSGCGKTTFAKKIADERRLAYFVSSGSNDIMDGYGQQPCLIIDDVRASSLGLSDLLKLLDNNTPSSVKSRYKNKYLNCELIIVTTVLPIEEFYHNVFDSETEPITQLKRRCQTLVVMDKSAIEISRWDASLMEYSEPQIFKNTILKEFEKPPKTKEQVAEEIHNLIPFLEPVEKELEWIQGTLEEWTEQDLPF